MPGWREFREFLRGAWDLVHDSWLFMWFLGPVTLFFLTLILWFSGLEDLYGAIVDPDLLDNLKEWQTAVSAIVGFVGLIITTALGFRFTIRQRREDARLAREAQDRQSDIDRDRDDRLRETEAKALAAALAAEFGSIVRELDFFHFQIRTVIKKTPTDAKHRSEFLESERAKLTYQPEFAIVTKAIERIGILGPGIADVAIGASGAVRGFFLNLQACDTRYFFTESTLAMIARTGKTALYAAQIINTQFELDIDLPAEFPIAAPPAHSAAPSQPNSGPSGAA